MEKQSEEKWLTEAKKRAKDEAEYFVEEMYRIAETNDIESEWFINEVVKHIHELKGKAE